MSHASPRFGPLLRDWRQRRRVTQMDLALDANISARHLSFLETGRARPSREMVLRLAEQLRVPMREQNVLLTAAGHAPSFAERSLDDPALSIARTAVVQVLDGQMPYPAIAVDRHWTLVASNQAVAALLGGVSETLLRPPINAMRLALHPDGLAPRIANLPAWRAHLLERLRAQIEASADPVLSDLLAELTAYPAPSPPPAHEPEGPAAVVPLELVTDTGTLRLFSTITVFGTPLDVTLSELAIESFFPADPTTREILFRLATRRAG